jgi:hypothetical protein
MVNRVAHLFKGETAEQVMPVIVEHSEVAGFAEIAHYSRKVSAIALFDFLQGKFIADEMAYTLCSLVSPQVWGETGNRRSFQSFTSHLPASEPTACLFACHLGQDRRNLKVAFNQASRCHNQVAILQLLRKTLKQRGSCGAQSVRLGLIFYPSSSWVSRISLCFSPFPPSCFAL